MTRANDTWSIFEFLLSAREISNNTNANVSYSRTWIIRVLNIFEN